MSMSVLLAIPQSAKARLRARERCDGERCRRWRGRGQGLEAASRCSAHDNSGTNPLQQPFAARDAVAGVQRRRRRGSAQVPEGIVHETPLDESSAKWIPDQVGGCLPACLPALCASLGMQGPWQAHARHARAELLQRACDELLAREVWGPVGWCLQPVGWCLVRNGAGWCFVRSGLVLGEGWSGLVLGCALMLCLLRRSWLGCTPQYACGREYRSASSARKGSTSSTAAITVAPVAASSAGRVGGRPLAPHLPSSSPPPPLLYILS